MPIVKLSQNFIANELQCPETKSRIEYCDSDFPGLYVEVRSSSSGHGTYYLRYKDSTGKTCHQKIGRTADITLIEARKQAKTLKAEISLGADPRGDVKAQKAVITLGTLFDDHYLPYIKPRKRSWKRDVQLFEPRIRDEFGDKRLNQLSRVEIQLFHSKLLDDGLAHATADHHVKVLRHMLNLAIDWGYLTVANPAGRVKLFNRDNKVEHYLDGDDLERLVQVLRTDSARNACLIAMFLLSTGARLNEALQATWGQIDRPNRVWRVEAKTSKSKKMRSIPLNDSALDILKELTTEDKSEYLFFNPETGKPLTTIHKVWDRLRIKAGLPHLRIHDLRHQYASFLVNSGRSLYEVQQILGHSDPKVTQRYSHLSTRTLQDAANCASLMIKGVRSAG